MTNGALVAAAGVGALVLAGQGAGGTLGLADPVPAGTTIAVNVSGFGPFLVMSTSSVPLQAQFAAQINSRNAGYVVISWNVSEQTLTSAILNNQVPYQGTFTITTTTGFATLADVQAAIAGDLYAVTGYTPTVNVTGGSAGSPDVTLNLGGLSQFINTLTGNLSTLTILALVAVGYLVWTERKTLIRAL